MHTIFSTILPINTLPWTHFISSLYSFTTSLYYIPNILLIHFSVWRLLGWKESGMGGSVKLRRDSALDLICSCKLTKIWLILVHYLVWSAIYPEFHSSSLLVQSLTSVNFARWMYIYASVIYLFLLFFIKWYTLFVLKPVHIYDCYK